MRFNCSSIKYFSWLAALLPTLLAHTEDAAALGLGELSVRSSLGARFRAEVRVVESPGDPRPSSECFRLSPAGDADPGIPVLAAGRLSLERQNGQSKLIITSDQIINEPVLQLDLRAGCGAEVVRSYTALIDPARPGQIARPSTMSSDSPVATSPAAPATPNPETWQASAGESAASIAKALLPGQPRAQIRFLAALAAENPQLDLSPRGNAPLDEGTTLAIPKKSRRAPPLPSVAETPPRGPATAGVSPARTGSKNVAERRSDSATSRLQISGDRDAALTEPEGLLRLSTELGAWPSKPISESGRALLRLEYQLLNALYAQSAQQLGIAERVRSLETNFAEMRAATETATRRIAAPTPPAMTLEAAGTDAPAPASARTPGPQGEEHFAWWPGIATLLGLIGALSWALRRKAARPAPIAGDQPEQAASAAEATEMRGIFSKASQQTSVPPAQPGAKAHPIAVDVLLDDSPTQPSGITEYDSHELSPSQTEAVIDERVDCGTAMELAEIMIAFGRVKGATQTLEDYLQHNPTTSLAPWLKLLEICRANELREDFEKYARQLESHFNVTPTSWEEAEASFSATLIAVSDQDAPIEELLAKLPAICSRQGIKDELLNAWNSPPGSIDLEGLLNATRDKSCSSVPLAMARELLFLAEIIEARRPKKS